MYSPSILSARTLRQYRVGPYNAFLCDQIISMGSIRYEYVIVVLDQNTVEPFFFVTSEINSSREANSASEQLNICAAEYSLSIEGSHFFCIFYENQHANFGDSDLWGALEIFEAEAMKVIFEYCGYEPFIV